MAALGQKQPLISLAAEGLLSASSGLSLFYPEQVLNRKKESAPKNTTVVVKAPTSYHRLFRRAPQLGQASALLLTVCPQSLHILSLANCSLLASASDQKQPLSNARNTTT